MEVLNKADENKRLNKLCNRFNCSRDDAHRYITEWNAVTGKFKGIKGLDKIKIVKESDI